MYRWDLFLFALSQGYEFTGWLAWPWEDAMLEWIDATVGPVTGQETSLRESNKLQSTVE